MSENVKPKPFYTRADVGLPDDPEFSDGRYDTQGRCKHCETRWVWDRRTGLSVSTAICPSCGRKLARTTYLTKAQAIYCKVEDGKLKY